MPRRLLVVATASVPAAALRESVRAHAGEDAETLVVAPAFNRFSLPVTHLVVNS